MDNASDKLVQATVGFDTEAVRAELAQLEQIVDRINVKLQGLPVARQVGATPLRRALGATIPIVGAGGLSERLKPSLPAVGGVILTDQVAQDDGGFGRPSQHGPARRARQSGSGVPFVPHSGSPARRAVEESGLEAMGRRLGNKFEQATNGFRATDNGLSLGGLLNVGAGGFAFRGLGNVLGPVAGYALAVVGLAKASDATQKSIRQTFREAMSGPVTHSFSETLLHSFEKNLNAKAKEVGGGIATFVVDDLLGSITKGAYAVVGAGLTVFAEALLSRGHGQQMMRQTEGAIQSIEYGIDKILRRPTKYQRQMSNQDKWNKAWDEVASEARQRAESEADDLALTLRNLGVPAHTTRIRHEIVDKLKDMRERQARIKFAEVNPPPPLSLGAQE